MTINWKLVCEHNLRFSLEKQTKAYWNWNYNRADLSRWTISSQNNVSSLEAFHELKNAVQRFGTSVSSTLRNTLMLFITVFEENFKEKLQICEI